MPLPINAHLQASQSFVRQVRSVREFLQHRDGASADERYGALLSRLKDARGHLLWNPAAGRPARFLQGHSAQSRILAARARALAVAHGVPEIRELVIRPYILLYAHGSDRVVLLALKHQRQLEFQFE